MVGSYLAEMYGILTRRTSGPLRVLVGDDTGTMGGCFRMTRLIVRNSRITLARVLGLGFGVFQENPGMCLGFKA